MLHLGEKEWSFISAYINVYYLRVEKTIMCIRKKSNMENTYEFQADNPNFYGISGIVQHQILKNSLCEHFQFSSL